MSAFKFYTMPGNLPHCETMGPQSPREMSFFPQKGSFFNYIEKKR